MTDEQKQKKREANKQYRNNITDKQKQKRREANRQYQKKYRDNVTDEQKQKNREANKPYEDKQKQKLKEVNSINDEQKLNDNDFYCISIIIKSKNIVPIKDINSILKINKKVCSQVYFINDNKNDFS